ncbi:acyl-CoA thioesterase II [Sphingobium sp. SCG-1]|uniref:acyl-CoA thioesterase n=1 Tax=Sphingobium sp. SCG-1 TaxID=2072936 RepID=UPI000CD68EBE|nr:acyl-CoA thioesterase domain-containing protein [Sphingobium sp. SCG-1]AUW57159.1 acyl-CoA thioesterase II [Sphingobium sp. SCG-1]
MNGLNPIRKPLPFEHMFAFEECGPDHFRSAHTDGRRRRVFGGQLLAQALAAGLQTVESDRPAHAFQVQFGHAGDSATPFDFLVERTANGRSFSSRHIKGMQGDKIVLSAMASFHKSEGGMAFQHAMPDAPPPETLRPMQDWRAEAILAAGGSESEAQGMRHLGFEVRPTIVVNVMWPEVQPPVQQFWARPYGPTPADPIKRQAMLAYLSDIMFLSTALQPHGKHWLSTPMHWASLNHTFRLHAPTDFSDWILWSMQVVWTGGGRGVVSGRMHDRGGRLLASASQEGLMRLADREERHG